MNFVTLHKSEGPNDPIPDRSFINVANGLSTRDWFAGMATQLFVRAVVYDEDDSEYRGAQMRVLAQDCYEFADAMLKEREKGMK